MKKLPDGTEVQKYQKEILKQWYLHYWNAPRAARGVKKFGGLNWRLLWWVGALKFSINWIKSKKPSENRVSLTTFVQFWQFWQFFTVASILAES